MQMKVVAKKQDAVLAHLCLNYEYGKQRSPHAGMLLSFLHHLHADQIIALQVQGNYYFLKDVITTSDS